MNKKKKPDLAVLFRWYKNFAEFKGNQVTTYKFRGKHYVIKVKSTKLFLIFEFVEEGKLVWTLPLTKKALRKIKKFLNRIGDL